MQQSERSLLPWDSLWNPLLQQQGENVHVQLLRPGQRTRTRARGSRPLQVACTTHALAAGRLAAVGRTPTPGSICGCCTSRAALAERGCAREDGFLTVLNESHAAVAPGKHRQFTRQTLRFTVS